MDKTQIDIINKLKQMLLFLERDNIKINEAILFGSYAKGNYREDSDIDIALVSDGFKGVRFYDRKKLSRYSIELDSRIESHPFNSKDFQAENNSFVKEIISTGIRIK